MSDQTEREQRYAQAIRENYTHAAVRAAIAIADQEQAAAEARVRELEAALQQSRDDHQGAVEKLRAVEGMLAHERIVRARAFRAAMLRREAREAHVRGLEARLRAVEGMPEQWLGSVAVSAALFDVLILHVTFTEQAGGGVAPYIWCTCGWRSDEDDRGEPDNAARAAAVHLTNVLHKAVTPAIQTSLRGRVTAALASPVESDTDAEGGAR
jgi:hypothetical protein